MLFPYMTVGVNLPTKLFLTYMQIRCAQFWLEHGHLFIRVASDEKITGWNRPWIIPSHSIESPGTLDPQWNIWYWGSKWNVHTVCRDAVGCGWGTTSVYFRITYVCFIPSRLPVFAVEPRYRLQYFLLSKESFEGHTQNLQKKSCQFKIWIGVCGQYWLWSCERLPFEVFFSCLCDGILGVTYADMLVTTQWPLKRAGQLTSIVWVFVVWRPESLMELPALCILSHNALSAPLCIYGTLGIS